MTVLSAATEPNDAAELRELFAVIRDETASVGQFREFEGRLLQDTQAADYYTRFMQLHVLLEEKLTVSRSPGDFSSPSSVRDHAMTPAGIIASPPSVLLSATLHNTLGYFPEGMPLAYLIATVVTGLGLLIGSLIHVSLPEQVARQSAPLPSPLSPLPSAVGWITGVVDCKWAKEGSGARGQGPGIENLKSQIPNPKSPVALGDRFALAAGLMEITYHTGAKVILQGPVTYAVESNGGYLAVGKLTGKLEKRGERREERGGGSANHQILNPKSKIVSPSPLSSLPSPLFVIRTPSAIVTDLGTEFGVEVTKDQQSHLHVFQGKVVVRPNKVAGKPAQDIELGEGESAQVASQGTVTRCSNAQSPTAANAARFVRKIPKRIIKTLDLVDVVAGGDGFSHRRGRGIVPANGRITDTFPQVTDELTHLGDGKFHRVEGTPFVDGVFTPDGSRGPVQVDSAGHRFSGFPSTCNLVSGYVWAGGVIPEAMHSPPIPTGFLGDVDYSSPGHGLIFLHANNAITFNLDAIRRTNPRDTLFRFRAVAGNLQRISFDPESFRADLWVLVDGVPKYVRRRFTSWNGPSWIAVPLAKGDRFLTLATTDGGDGINCDWTMFGDPLLELVEASIVKNTSEVPVETR